MSRILWTQDVDIEHTSQFLIGPAIELPIAPFPGLMIGALTVKTVRVCQGDESTHCLTYEDIDVGHANVLVSRGWRIDDYEEPVNEHRGCVPSAYGTTQSRL